MENAFESTFKDRTDRISEKLNTYLTDMSNILFSEINKQCLQAKVMDFTCPKAINCIKSIKIDTTNIKSTVQIINSKNLIAVGEKSGLLSLWSLDRLTKLASLKSFNTEFSQISYCEERDLLFTSSKNCLKTFKINRSAKRPITLIKESKFNTNIGFMLAVPSQNAIVTSEGLQNTVIRDFHTFEKRGSFPKSGHSIYHIKKYDYAVIDYYDGLVGMIDLKNMREIARIEIGQRFSHVVEWAYCDKDNLLYASLSCGKLKAWNLNVEGLMYESDRVVPKMSCLSAFNNGSILLFSRDDRSLWGYDTKERNIESLVQARENIKGFKIIPEKHLLMLEVAGKLSLYSYSSSKLAKKHKK